MQVKPAKKIFEVLANMAHSDLMFPAVDTRDALAVAREVCAVCRNIFPAGKDHFITREIAWIQTCFEGGCDGYQALDARYHDSEHTFQGTLCLMRLLRGRHVSGAQPVLTEKMFELALLAILMHDTGYLKLKGDVSGTGAKYTLTHVRRSAEFAGERLRSRGFTESDVQAVQNMIRCTGVNVDVAAIPFSDELERTIGFALSTADLLAQMAADDYVDKLPVLFEEFSEAAAYNKGHVNKPMNFASAEALVRNTPKFWESYVWPKINNDFGQLYQYLNDPYPDGPNEYLEGVRANLARIQREHQ